MKSTTLKKAALLPVICLSLLCFGQAAGFTVNNEKENGKIEFVKSENGQLFFEVDIKNIPPGGCVLRIINQEGEEIFENNLKEGSYHKTFQIPNEGITKIFFDVNGKKYRLSESFNLEFKVETRLAVTKI
ncbi:MAG: hypothetical protein EOP53_20675 [Sphingobacteriales bacterium]|nr:MAG: hypothetical protein EOP53_20675 [Sphingobacteriales bacterium]